MSETSLNRTLIHLNDIQFANNNNEVYSILLYLYLNHKYSDTMQYTLTLSLLPPPCSFFT